MLVKVFADLGKAEKWDELRKEVKFGVPLVPRPLSTSGLSRLLSGRQQGAPLWDNVATLVVACATHADNAGRLLSGKPPMDELHALLGKSLTRHEDLLDDLVAAAERGGPLGALVRHRAEVQKASVQPDGVPRACLITPEGRNSADRGPAVDVRSLLEEGRLDEAEDVARTIPNTDSRVRAFTSLVGANAMDRRSRSIRLAA